MPSGLKGSPLLPLPPPKTFPCSSVGGNLQWLTHVRLDRQRITAVETGALAGMPRLFNLYLQHNRLTAVPDLSGLETLRFLALSHNGIEQVTEHKRAAKHPRPPTSRLPTIISLSVFPFSTFLPLNVSRSSTQRPRSQGSGTSPTSCFWTLAITASRRSTPASSRSPCDFWRCGSNHPSEGRKVGVCACGEVGS